MGCGIYKLPIDQKQLDTIPQEAGQHVIADLHHARYVDYRAMENLHNYERDFTLVGGGFHVINWMNTNQYYHLH